MALTNNFLPQTSLVFGVRDFAPQIAQQGQADTQALQNMFKFGTKIYDYMQSRKQADLIEKDTQGKKDIEAKIAEDKASLAKLENELATLMGGE